MSSQASISSDIPLPTSTNMEVSYWDKDPASWDLNDFDFDYVTKHPSANKSEAHQALQSEILLMRSYSKKSNFIKSKLAYLEKSLRQSSRDPVNNMFWMKHKEKLANSVVEEKVAQYQAEVGVSQYLASAIKKRAQALDQVSPKRQFEGSENGSSGRSASSGEYRKRRVKQKTSQIKAVTRTATLSESDAKWFVGEENISEKLLEVRKDTVSKHEKKKNLQDYRELALSHIFLFSRSQNHSVTRDFGTEGHTKVLQALPTVMGVSLPLKATTWSKEILDMINGSMPALSLKECKRKTAEWIVEACDDDDDSLLIFADILHRSVPRLLSATNSNNVEDTFVHNAVTDLLDVVFGEDQKLCHEWANKKFPGTEASVLMKPDFMAATKPSHRVVYLFSVEIKPPTKTRDDDVCEDRVKLGVQMKAMLQVLESLHLRSPQTCGLLIQGFDCTVYQMDSVYKPIYRMMEIGTFKLIGKSHELALLPNAVERLLACKAIVQHNAKKVEDHYR